MNETINNFKNQTKKIQPKTQKRKKITKKY